VTFRGPKAHREHRPECDRHFSEHLARLPRADDALDPVDALDRLDATLEHREQRAVFTFLRRVLARYEADVRRHLGEPCASVELESCEDLDPPDVLSRHHEPQTLLTRLARC
jgi:hypothetical protein